MSNDQKSSWFNIDKIEDFVWYFIMCSVIAMHILGLIIHNIEDFITNNVNLNFFLFLLIIAIFRILYKRISYLSMRIFPREFDVENLHDELRRVLKKHPRIKELDMIGYSSRRFYHAMEEFEFVAEKVRILVYDPSENPFIQNYVDLWRAGLPKADIRSLELKKYKFKPVIFGIAINRRDGYFGLFSPSKSKDPLNEPAEFPLIYGFYRMHADNQFGREWLKNFCLWFDEAYDEHSVELS